MAPTTPLLTIREVAERLNVSAEVVIGLIHDGALVGRRIGKRYRVDPEELHAYYESTKVPVKTEAAS